MLLGDESGNTTVYDFQLLTQTFSNVTVTLTNGGNTIYTWNIPINANTVYPFPINFSALSNIPTGVCKLTTVATSSGGTVPFGTMDLIFLPVNPTIGINYTVTDACLTQPQYEVCFETVPIIPGLEDFMYWEIQGGAIFTGNPGCAVFQRDVQYTVNLVVGDFNYNFNNPTYLTCVSSVTFKVEGPPVVSLSPTSYTGCIPPNAIQINTTTTKGRAPFTYSWSPIAGLFTSTSEDPLLTPGSAVVGNYTVTATDANGCTATAVFAYTPTNCCSGTVHPGANGNQPLTFFNVSASQLLSAFSSTNGIITTNATIAINNMLTVDANLTFLNCPNIRFGKDAVANVNNGIKLTVDNSILQSCTTAMWLGVRASGVNTHVEVRNGGSIREAGIAIQSNNNARITTSTSATFLDNFIGLQINNSLGGAQISVQRTTFGTLTATVLKTVPTSLIGLYPVNTPNTLSRGYTGIEVNNSTNVAIQSTGNNTNANFFTKLECGIFSFNSSMTLVYNQFTNCNKTGGGSQLVERRGWGSYYRNTSTTTHAYAIGTSSTYWQNHYISCDNGSRVDGLANLGIRYNYYKNVTTNSVLVQNLNSCPAANINNNTIENTTSGISWLLNPATIVNISNNKVFATINAINLGDNNNTTAQKTVAQNDMQDVRYGIQLSSVSNVNLDRNYVKMNPTQHVGLEKIGIWVSNCTGLLTSVQNFIDGNYLSGGTAPANTRGIVSVTSPNASFQCDSIIRCQWAIRGVGNSNPTEFRAVAMRDCNAGIVIDGAGAQFGPQFWIAIPPFGFSTNDNKWWGSTFNIGHTFARQGANGVYTTLYFRNPSPGAEFFPNPFGNNKDAGFGSVETSTIVWNGINHALRSCQNNYNTFKNEEASMQDIGTYEQIATGQMVYNSALEPQLEQLDREVLFEHLKNVEDLRAESSILDSFYNANVSNSLGATVNSRDAAAMAYNAATADAALQSAADIAPQNLSEANTKTIQEIYLQTYGRGDAQLDSAQLVLVEAIARQCFVFGGPSVFLARTMYYTATGSIDNSFQDFCLENYGSYKTEQVPSTENIAAKMLLSVSPNPVANGNELWITSNKPCKVKVYSSVGQQIDSFSVDTGANQVSLNNTSKGIYFLKFVSDNGDLFTKTLVVD